MREPGAHPDVFFLLVVQLQARKSPFCGAPLSSSLLAPHLLCQQSGVESQRNPEGLSRDKYFRHCSFKACHLVERKQRVYAVEGDMLKISDSRRLLNIGGQASHMWKVWPSKLKKTESISNCVCTSLVGLWRAAVIKKSDAS